MAQKLHLQHLKSQDKKPFIETRFGQGCYKVLGAITSPFASLHAKAKNVVSDPQEVQLGKMVKLAREALRKAEKIETNTTLGARAAAVQCAKSVTLLEAFNVRTEGRFGEARDLIQSLRSEVDRLRSPEAQAAKEKIESQLGDLLKTVTQSPVTNQ
jgi:hypothetical protein